MAANTASKLLNLSSPAALRNLLRPSATAACTNPFPSTTTTPTEIFQLEKENSAGSLGNSINAKQLNLLAYDLPPLNLRSSVAQIEAARKPAFEDDVIDDDFVDEDEDDDDEDDDDDDNLMYSGSDIDDVDDDEFVDDYIPRRERN